MSRANVELVLALTPARDVDVAPIFRDDDTWAASVEAMAAVVHPDFECVGTLFGTETAYAGMEGFRAFFLDWLAPWAMYRTEVEKTIDLGERVVVIYRVFGRRQGSTQEVESTASWVWTARDRKIARIKGYSEPVEALEAVRRRE
jgi:ketosteroid isomerase-like protein